MDKQTHSQHTHNTRKQNAQGNKTHKHPHTRAPASTAARTRGSAVLAMRCVLPGIGSLSSSACPPPEAPPFAERTLIQVAHTKSSGLVVAVAVVVVVVVAVVVVAVVVVVAAAAAAAVVAVGYTERVCVHVYYVSVT
jgi:hypothetical protein